MLDVISGPHEVDLELVHVIVIPAHDVIMVDHDHGIALIVRSRGEVARGHVRERSVQNDEVDHDHMIDS